MAVKTVCVRARAHRSYYFYYYQYYVKEKRNDEVIVLNFTYKNADCSEEF